MLLLCNNLLTKSAAWAPVAPVSRFRWRVNICADATGTGSRDNQQADEGPSPPLPSLKTTCAVASAIKATNLGLDPGPTTLGPCGVPDSPQTRALSHQSSCSAPTLPDHHAFCHVPRCVHTPPPTYPCHAHTCSIIPLDLNYTSRKTKLLISKQWQQTLKPSLETFWAQSPMPLHKSSAHQASPAPAFQKQRVRWGWKPVTSPSEKLQRQRFQHPITPQNLIPMCLFILRPHPFCHTHRIPSRGSHRLDRGTATVIWPRLLAMHPNGLSTSFTVRGFHVHPPLGAEPKTTFPSPMLPSLPPQNINRFLFYFACFGSDLLPHASSSPCPPTSWSTDAGLRKLQSLR